jgi:hypothetical protein
MSLLTGIGGSTIYIRENSSIEYSTNQQSWSSITFPCTIQNINTSSGVLTIKFTTNITFTTANEYFICGSTHIQFGSSSLNPGGSRPVITIDGVTNYPGLIQNGTVSSDGYSNIYVYNLVVETLNDSTLRNNDFGGIGSGWIGQTYYGRGANANYIINCTSSGPISVCSGGIIGTYAGPSSGNKGNITILGCSSSGTIGTNGGGIIGQVAGATGWGDIICESCWSTGIISMSGGGIMGLGAGARAGTVVRVTNCYSEGLISTNAGGICGTYCGGQFGIESGSITIANCYSTGNIQTGMADGAGGIVGGSCNENVIITNCYSTGDISDTAGGIVGNTPSILQANIRHCYTSGIITASGGYIIANSFTIPTTCFGEGTGSWNSTNANTTLQGVPAQTVGTTWVNTTANQPYELRNMGYTPYTIQNITATPELNRSYSESIPQGQSSIPAVLADASGNQFIILQGYEGITMNVGTGVLSVASDVPYGTYTVILRSVGSYNITEFILTVPGDANAEVTCCEKANFLRGPIDGITVTELREGNTLIGYMSSRRGLVPSSALLAIKKAYAFKR